MTNYQTPSLSQIKKIEFFELIFVITIYRESKMAFNFNGDFAAEIDAINAATEVAALNDAIKAVADAVRVERERELVAGQHRAWALAQEWNHVQAAVDRAVADEFAAAVADIPDIDNPPP